MLWRGEGLTGQYYSHITVFIYSSCNVIENTAAGKMDLDKNPLIRNIDRNSLLYRSESTRSDTDGVACSTRSDTDGVACSTRSDTDGVGDTVGSSKSIAQQQEVIENPVTAI